MKLRINLFLHTSLLYLNLRNNKFTLLHSHLFPGSKDVEDFKFNKQSYSFYRIQDI